jgi:single-strand selective monofunctional uracil DNA glycosylase
MSLYALALVVILNWVVFTPRFRYTEKIMSSDKIVAGLLSAARELAETAGAAADEAPSPPVHRVYNPLEYGWEPHRDFIRRFGGGEKRVLFLGMNPGPWGMAQTGVPFGEVAAVRDWLGVKGRVFPPAGEGLRAEHPKRRIEGFACPRSEVSGRRFWALMAGQFSTPAAFFRDHWVANYCPLVFMTESGANLTPDKLPRDYREKLYALCGRHLIKVIRLLKPRFLVGVGKFAEQRFLALKLPERPGEDPPAILSILHPSPASPAANSGWEAAVRETLKSRGIWN